MMKLLKKEMRLSASALSYIFIAMGLMTFLPGYPILVGTFYAALGIFQTFRASREANDITYTALLPIAKGDTVKGKYAFSLFIEACYFILCAAVTLVRMTLLSGADVYVNNVLMNANLCYLGFVLLMFGCFNMIFIGGFFKTAYKFGKPFVLSIIAMFLITAVGETLVHIPGMDAFRALGFECLGAQLAIFISCVVIFAAMTYFSMKRAIKNFVKLDI